MNPRLSEDIFVRVVQASLEMATLYGLWLYSGEAYC